MHWAWERRPTHPRLHKVPHVNTSIIYIYYTTQCSMYCTHRRMQIPNLSNATRQSSQSKRQNQNSRGINRIQQTLCHALYAMQTVASMIMRLPHSFCLCLTSSLQSTCTILCVWLKCPPSMTTAVSLPPLTHPVSSPMLYFLTRRPFRESWPYSTVARSCFGRDFWSMFHDWEIRVSILEAGENSEMNIP